VIDRQALHQRVNCVKQQIEQACRRAGRDPSEVTLLPVSKTFGPDAIGAMVELGFKRFGENRLQEVAQKQPVLAEHDLQWVIIGHVQTNKAKEVAKYARELQSLDRLALAQALHNRLVALDKTLDVLVQVKTSDEQTKSGVDPDELIDFLKATAAYPSLKIKGLMTMAVFSPDTNAVRQCFKLLRQCQQAAIAANIEGAAFDRLSMGMSGDMEIAIEEGSTEVRVGSAIFGAR
jgi:pyridoxal phosphate enzyme (YggS family)